MPNINLPEIREVFRIDSPLTEGADFLVANRWAWYPQKSLPPTVVVPAETTAVIERLTGTDIRVRVVTCPDPILAAKSHGGNGNSLKFTVTIQQLNNMQITRRKDLEP